MDYVLAELWGPPGQMLGACQAPYALSGQPDGLRSCLGALREVVGKTGPPAAQRGCRAEAEVPGGPLGPRVSLHWPGSTKCGRDSMRALRGPDQRRQLHAPLPARATAPLLTPGGLRAEDQQRRERASRPSTVAAAIPGARGRQTAVPSAQQIGGGFPRTLVLEGFPGLRQVAGGRPSLGAQGQAEADQDPARSPRLQGCSPAPSCARDVQLEAQLVLQNPVTRRGGRTPVCWDGPRRPPGSHTPPWLLRPHRDTPAPPSGPKQGSTSLPGPEPRPGSTGF